MEKDSVLLSIVSPVYQAENLLDELVERLIAQASSITDHFEIILVEDGGKDRSWGKIEENCRKYKQVKGIQLTRNFGQHSAITAGIEASLGKWTVVMDCDLQDLPEEIPYLYRKAEEGYDIVLARREERKDGLWTRLSSKIFNAVLSLLSEVKFDCTIANFGIYHRSAIQSMLQVQNSVRYFPSMVKWVGFNQTQISVRHAERPRGKSSYSFAKKLKLSLNIVIAYSDKLLRAITGIGLLISLLAFCFAVWIVFRAVSGTISIAGYPSLIVSISFFSGVIIFVLGVLGLYIGKILENSGARPSYLIRRKMND